MKYLKSEDGQRFVSLGRIKEFTLTEVGHERWQLRAYLSQDDRIIVATFKTKEAGNTWLELYLSNA